VDLKPCDQLGAYEVVGRLGRGGTKPINIVVNWMAALKK
jgi:hypothetical protein